MSEKEADKYFLDKYGTTNLVKIKEVQDARDVACAEHHRKHMAEKEPLVVNYDPLLAARHINKINTERSEPHHEPALPQRQVERTPLQRWRKSHVR